MQKDGVVTAAGGDVVVVGGMVSSSQPSTPCSPKKGSKSRPVVGVVSIVDLAAAESMRLTGGQEHHNSKGNQSLLALNRVIHELASRGAHVTYRGSKLTRLLEPCLTTNSQISILCCMTTAQW